MPTENDSESVFPADIFTRQGPVQFRQGRWLDQTEFLAELRRSWVAQYSDYLGEQAAITLVQQLLDDGSLYEHDPNTTLQAWVAGELVGIAALRLLDGLSLITLLEVHSSHQGQGIGRELLKGLETASARLLAHVSIHRPQLKTFYKSCGFIELQPDVIDHYGHQLTFDVMVRSTLIDEQSR